MRIFKLKSGNRRTTARPRPSRRPPHPLSLRCRCSPSVSKPAGAAAGPEPERRPTGLIQEPDGRPSRPHPHLLCAPRFLTRLDPRQRRSRVNPRRTMSLVDHLRELRTRLLISVFAIALTTVAGFLWYSHWCSGWCLGEHCEPYCSRFRRRRVPTSALTGLPAVGDGALRPVHAPPQSGHDGWLGAGLPRVALRTLGVHHPCLYKNERRFAVTFVVFAAMLFVRAQSWPTSCWRKHCTFC